MIVLPAILASSAGHAVEPSVTYLFFGLLACMILCLALEEKIHAKKSVIVGIFSILVQGMTTGPLIRKLQASG